MIDTPQTYPELIEMVAQWHHENYRGEMANGNPPINVKPWEELGDILQNNARINVTRIFDALTAHNLHIAPNEATWEMQIEARNVQWPQPDVYGDFTIIGDMDEASTKIYAAMNAANPLRKDA